MQRAARPSAAVIDELSPRAGYDGYKRRMGRKVHKAVDTLGQLIVLTLTPANA